MSLDQATHSADCLVIGAGMAGLTASRILADHGLRVLVLDKGRGVGGRMATRNNELGRYDHGCPHFEATTPEFIEQTQRWIDDGLVEHWHDSPSRITTRLEHFRPRQGMSSLLRTLASPLEVHSNLLVERVVFEGGQWRAIDGCGRSWFAPRLLLTPPIPQAVGLLDAGKIHLPPSERAELDSVEYDRSIAILVALSEPSALVSEGAVIPEHGPIAWVGDRRDVNADGGGIVLRSTHEFAMESWDRPRDAVSDLLLRAASRWIRGQVVAHQYHRWRYGTTESPLAAKFFQSEAIPGLVIAGDGMAGECSQWGVERAWLSGRAAASALLSIA